MPARFASARELWTVVAIAALPIAFFAPVWARGLVFLSDGQYEAYFAPLANWADAWIGGWPAGADPAAYVWYPVRLLLLWSGLGFDAFVVSAYAIAAVGTYAYLRILGLARAAAAFGALSFAFSGFMVAQLLHTSMIHAAAWVPWIFAGVEGCLTRGERRCALVTAAAVALACLAGHTQIAFYGLFFVVVYLVWRAPALWRAPRSSRWLLATGGLALGILLAAPQLLMTRAYVAETPRVLLRYEDFVAYSLPIAQLPTLLFPFLFGGNGRPLGTPYFGAENFAELTLYVPFLSVALALAGTRFVRRDVATFWIVVAGVALLLALGGSVPPAARLVYRVPGFDLFRVPARHAMEFCLAISVLAACGIDWLTGRPPAVRWRFVAAVAALALVVVALSLPAHRSAALTATAARLTLPAWSRDPAIWSGLAGLAVGVIGAAALASGRHFGGGVFAVAAALGLTLFAGLADWRLGASEGGGEATAIERDFAARLGVEGGRVLHAQGGWRTRFTLGRMRKLGVPSVNWYGPLIPAHAMELLEITTNGVVKPSTLSASNQVLDVYGVRYAAINDMPSELHLAKRAALVPPRWRPVASEGDTTVYENVRALPLAWLCPTWRDVPPDAARRLLQEGGAFDARREALVVGLPSGGTAGAGQGTVDARWIGDGAIVADVESSAGGFVVFSVNGLAGWTATVDGVPQPHYTADYALLGLPVTPGRHQVALAHRVSVWPFAVAWTAALLGVAACALQRSREGRGLRQHRSP